jgi:hypothetical protein
MTEGRRVRSLLGTAVHFDRERGRARAAIAHSRPGTRALATSDRIEVELRFDACGMRCSQAPRKSDACGSRRLRQGDPVA